MTATDKTNDLALLKVTANNIKPLSLGDSDKVRIGETVYVAGNPKGLEGTFSDGIISSRRDKLTKERLQMTVPISPGSSGGPVLNRRGEVIGVSVSVHRALDAQNLNFAIPSKYLKILQEQKKPAKPLPQGKQPIPAETYLQWGFVKYELGNYWGAILDCTRAILLRPDYVEAYHFRGYVKHVWGDNAGAVADYTKTIRLKPDYAIAYYDRGNVKFKLGQYAAAINDFDITIRLKPDDAAAYYNRGVAKYNLGHDFAAISDYDIAIRLNPDDGTAYVARGIVKVKLGQHFAAISDYDKAISLTPDFAEAYIKRGLTKSFLGRTWEAKQDLQKALKLAEKARDVRLKSKIELMLKEIG